MIGRDYIWTNDHTYHKIDRALENIDWVLQMSVVKVNVLNPEFSNHTSIKLELGKDCRGAAKSFIFFRYLAKHPDFISKVREAWQVSQMGDMKVA